MPPTLRPSLYPLRRTPSTVRLSSLSAISKEEKKMEQGPLKNGQLAYLARHDAVLGPGFQGVFAKNALPNKLITTQLVAYLVN